MALTRWQRGYSSLCLMMDNSLHHPMFLKSFISVQDTALEREKQPWPLHDVNDRDH